MAQEYASGNWKVRDGDEETFIDRWREWLSSSTANMAGFSSAALLRDPNDPHHFVSVSIWEDAGARDQWKTSQEFAKGFEGVRELCDEFMGGDYEAVVRL